MSRQSATQSAAISELAVLYDRNGYVRRHNPARRKADGCMVYKKGDEVRLVANTPSELARILQLLRTKGFKPGRPFLKHKQGSQYQVPLYGREQVARFLRKIEETKQCQQGAAPYSENRGGFPQG